MKPPQNSMPIDSGSIHEPPKAHESRECVAAVAGIARPEFGTDWYLADQALARATREIDAAAIFQRVPVMRTARVYLHPKAKGAFILAINQWKRLGYRVKATTRGHVELVRT